MSFQATVLKVMIASPSDVEPERAAIRDVLNEWTLVNAERRKIVLLPIGWETHSVPELGAPPQTIINRTVLEGCDLLVGVFWTRLGTPTASYASGTVEEIERHSGLNKPTLLYFSQAPVEPDSVDPAQYQQLLSFRKSCQQRGIYERFTNLQDFRDKFARHLQLEMNKPGYAADATGPPVAVSKKEVPISLSREARVLLKDAAAGAGQIAILKYLSGMAIQIGEKNYVESGSPRSEAAWEDAANELESQGLIIQTSPQRMLFRLTRAGYEMVDRISI